mgnify:FL=1
MRRVVITGIGIVSSIGNNKEEVLSSLYNCKSGIILADGYKELGFRSQVHGLPKLNPADFIDRRKQRFLADGSGWAYIATEQAIADSGLLTEDISNINTGLIVGTGGPSTKAIVQAADATRGKGVRH